MEQRKGLRLIERFRSTFRKEDNSEEALAEKGERINAELEKSKKIVGIRDHEGWPIVQERIARNIVSAQDKILRLAISPIENAEELRTTAAERLAYLRLLTILEVEEQSIKQQEEKLTKVMRTIADSAAIPSRQRREDYVTTVGGPSPLERK
ncbi:MAG TPA: hypothetical protein VFI02_14065 [Armatimonadota bacterium]|nr:hypothetical protein [Armatimonadota bacterium]